MKEIRHLGSPGRWAVAVVLSWALAGGASGQTSVSSPETRGTQFVFVVDDSRSMREELPTDNHPAADPDRLSIFAVQALLSMLDPTDEATVVRLNGPLEGDPPPPIEPLAENAGRLQELLALDRPLADYAGDYTPCKTALEATRRLLNEAHRQDVAQVVFFLTDGECTPRSSEVPEVPPFLAGVSSHAEQLFRFYLLRFDGRPYTPSLVELARATGGQSIKVSGEEPTDILAPFADALTHSQGYEAELLTSASPELAAHLGARRVRLLAVAPGESPELSFRIADRTGKSPSSTATDPGVHRYGDGRAYRWAALDYSPTEAPMTVHVEGAGERWKVVAVPEYRLAVTMQIFRGPCGSLGAPVEHGTEAGHPVCAVLRLVNERGLPVERSGIGGELAASVRYTRCNEEPQDLVAVPRGELAEFVFERQRLVACDHVFTPSIVLTLPGRGKQIELTGRRRSLEASSLDMVARPANLEIGLLHPAGESKPHRLTLEGNFPQGEGHLEVANRQALPSCLTFTLNGEPEGAPVTLAPGGHYTLVARLAAYCGPESFERRFDPRLRIVLDAEGITTAAEIGTSLDATYRFDLPRPPTVQVEAGDSVLVRLALGGNQEHGFEMEALLAGAGERDEWSDDLTLGFAAGDETIERKDGKPVEAKIHQIDPAAEAAPIALRLRVDRCCAGGVYETFVGLVPAGGAYGGEPPPPVTVPLRVEVTPAGFWACRGGLILWALALLLILLLAFYLISMFRHSSFLSRDQLAQLLIPLSWNDFGDVQRESRLAGEVRALVEQEMPLGERILAWFAANPLRIGLPGGRYDETVELMLQPERAVDRSRLHVVRESGLYRRLAEDPAHGSGRLFARAVGRSGIEFFAVLKHGRIGRLAPARLASNPWNIESAEAQTPRVFTLKRKEKLLYPIAESDRQKGQAAGWQVG